MYCYSCGSEVVDGALFCSKCGTKLQPTTLVKNESEKDENEIQPSSSSNSRFKGKKLRIWVLPIASLIIVTSEAVDGLFDI